MNGTKRDILFIFVNSDPCGSFALKTLGQVDPYDICVKRIAVSADLYWSIIWYYGSVYTALKEIGKPSS